MTSSPSKSTDEALTRRALRHAMDGTTDMADRELKVPLHYYRDPKITEIEESQILRRVPLAIVPSAQIPAPNDYVVRTLLGDSLLVTRDRTGASHVLLNYCRHRGAMPACGSGNTTASDSRSPGSRIWSLGRAERRGRRTPGRAERRGRQMPIRPGRLIRRPIWG